MALAYHGVRDRVSELVVSVTDAQLSSVTPATPDWRVRDVLAHLAGVASDIVDGNLDGVATDAWTSAQVEARRETPIPQILAEWEEHGAQVDAMVDQFPPDAAKQLVTDAVTHEHDIRGALGTSAGRDTAAVAIAMDWMLGFVGLARDADGAGALSVETTGDCRVAGSGSPTATLRVDRFELVRAMIGRRALEQLLAYDWDGNARPELLVIGFFEPRPTPLVE